MIEIPRQQKPVSVAERRERQKDRRHCTWEKEAMGLKVVVNAAETGGSAATPPTATLAECFGSLTNRRLCKRSRRPDKNQKHCKSAKLP